MPKIKCLIADDEAHARTLMRTYVNQVPYLELVAECANGKEALNALENKDVDVAFLDIQMPDITGMALAKTINQNIKVVFTTAFNDYAIEGYELNAVGYLLKPFSLEEFLKTAARLKALLEHEKQTSVSLGEEFIMIKADYKIYQVEIRDIIYIEGVKDYVKIYRQSNNKVLMPLMTMKSLVESLPSAKFMRVHRSYIVNLDKINIIERNQIVFDGVRITISEQYKEAFNAFLNRRFGA